MLCVFVTFGLGVTQGSSGAHVGDAPLFLRMERAQEAAVCVSFLLFIAYCHKVSGTLFMNIHKPMSY